MIRAILSDRELNVFFINPTAQFAFETAELTCSCHMPSDELRTHKSLSHSVTHLFSCNEIIHRGFLSAWPYISLDMFISNRISSSFRSVPSSTISFPSSALSLNLWVRLSGRSFIYSINSNGPRTDYWCNVIKAMASTEQPCISPRW